MARQDTNRAVLGIESSTAKSYPQSLKQREKKLAEAVLYDENIDDDFPQALVCSNTTNTGAAYTGAAAEVVAFQSGRYAYEIYQAAVAVAAIVMPFQSADGLELRPVAAADALELTNGVSALSSAAYTVGSFPQGKSIFCQVKFKIDDISDVTEIFYGFRKAEAYQADPDNYDEMCSFNVGLDLDGQIEIHTILNNTATVETDTTLADWADAGEHTLRIELSPVGIASFQYDAAVPTVTASFDFDNAEVLIPFFHMNSEIGDPGVSISQWQVGVM